MLKLGWYIERLTKYGDMCSVEYDWGVSVLKAYFNTYKEALGFVERYKKRIRLENRMWDEQ